MDEVNLLDDGLVDVVLDSAASGINTVEREGISIQHPAKFIMIGSGNPQVMLSRCENRLIVGCVCEDDTCLALPAKPQSGSPYLSRITQAARSRLKRRLCFEEGTRLLIFVLLPEEPFPFAFEKQQSASMTAISTAYAFTRECPV